MTPKRPRDGAGNDSDGRPLDTDAVFEALADERRRHVVRILRSSDGVLDVEDLARRVVARERRTTAPSVPPRDVQRVAARLYHADLLKLQDAALVEFDRERRRVRSLVDLSDLSAVLADALERPGL